MLSGRRICVCLCAPVDPETDDVCLDSAERSDNSIFDIVTGLGVDRDEAVEDFPFYPYSPCSGSRLHQQRQFCCMALVVKRVFHLVIIGLIGIGVGRLRGEVIPMQAFELDQFGEPNPVVGNILF